MEARAVLKKCPTSPQKMRLVADLVRGKDVNQALAILKYQSKVGAGYMHKLLLSAIANWQQANPDERVEDAELYIKTIFVDGGAMLKRMRPAPQGRGYKIRKRSNHLTIILDSKVQESVEEVTDESAVEEVIEDSK
ncbi:MAG: 50S ribosomal protein L22 [Bacteroidota bacterium]|nr:50S ribosomal protein L22 [Bacteroidota bacterium]